MPFALHGLRTCSRVCGAGGFADSSVRVFDVASQNSNVADGAAPGMALEGGATMLWGHSAAVNAVDFSPDLRLLFSASVDGTIRLWSLGLAANLVAYRCAAIAVLVKLESSVAQRFLAIAFQAKLELCVQAPGALDAQSLGKAWHEFHKTAPRCLCCVSSRKASAAGAAQPAALRLSRQPQAEIGLPILQGPYVPGVGCSVLPPRPLLCQRVC